MKKNGKMLNEVNQMKNLMRYMNGEKVSLKGLKKGKINESKGLLKEGVSDDYSMEVKVRVDIPYQTATIKGKVIEEIEVSPIRVTYGIEIEAREWGIKDINIHNISGPSEIDIYITYYDNFESDDSSMSEAVVTIPVNWELLEEYNMNGNGVITVSNEMTMDINNDENGNLVVGKMNIDVYTADE